MMLDPGFLGKGDGLKKTQAHGWATVGLRDDSEWSGPFWELFALPPQYWLRESDLGEVSRSWASF
jgi:hypothetical protein